MHTWKFLFNSHLFTSSVLTFFTENRKGVWYCHNNKAAESGQANKSSIMQGEFCFSDLIDYSPVCLNHFAIQALKVNRKQKSLSVASQNNLVLKKEVLPAINASLPSLVKISLKKVPIVPPA